MFFPLFFDPEYRSIGHPSLLSRIQATSKCQSPTSQCNAIILPHRSGADIFELSIDCESYVVWLQKIIWLVVSNILYFPFHIWDNPSHWLSYFSRWWKPPTSNSLLGPQFFRLGFVGGLMFEPRLPADGDPRWPCRSDQWCLIAVRWQGPDLEPFSSFAKILLILDGGNLIWLVTAWCFNIWDIPSGSLW